MKPRLQGKTDADLDPDAEISALNIPDYDDDNDQPSGE
jgi:hypothetical protein